MSTAIRPPRPADAGSADAGPADAGVAHPHRLTARALTRHFLEMVVAMAVGMAALHPVWTVVLDAVGAPGLMENPYSGALIMATDMTVAMSAWMRVRGHRWRPIAEMGAAMYLPFLVLFVPFALGVVSESALLLWGHVLMLPAMAAAMLLRPSEYAAC